MTDEINPKAYPLADPGMCFPWNRTEIVEQSILSSFRRGVSTDSGTRCGTCSMSSRRASSENCLFSRRPPIQSQDMRVLKIYNQIRHLGNNVLRGMENIRGSWTLQQRDAISSRFSYNSSPSITTEACHCLGTADLELSLAPMMEFNRILNRKRLRRRTTKTVTSQNCRPRSSISCSRPRTTSRCAREPTRPRRHSTEVSLPSPS